MGGGGRDEANASRKLVAVCSEYKYWGTLVAEVEPAARPAAAFDIGDAEQLLVRAFEESNGETMTAGGLKSKMLALDASFDEHNYGCRSFRAFLAMLPQRVQIVEAGGPDLTVKLTRCTCTSFGQWSLMDPRRSRCS